jgi:hypothetical protein
MTHSGVLLAGAVWAIVATVATFVVHAAGMGLVVSVTNALERRASATRIALRANNVLLVAVAMVVVVHLVEIVLWIGGFVWRHSISSVSAGYETVSRQSGDVTLLVHWQLLALVAAVLTVAWSAIVLLSLSRRLENAQPRSS